VEVGETLREATQREAREETGLTVEAGEVIEVLDRIIRDDNGKGSVHYHYVLIDFLCRLRGGELLAGGDAAAAEWATEDELKKFKLDKLAMDVIAKAFALAKA